MRGEDGVDEVDDAAAARVEDVEVEEGEGEEAAPAGGEDGAPRGLVNCEDGDQDGVREVAEAVAVGAPADVRRHLRPSIACVWCAILHLLG